MTFACKDPPGDPILIIDLVGNNSKASDIATLGFSPSRVELLISATATGAPETIIVPDSGGKTLTLTFDANNSARDFITLFSPRSGFLHQIRFIEETVVVSGPAAPTGTALAKVPSGGQTGIKISPADGVPFELKRDNSTRIEVRFDVAHQVNRPKKTEFHFKPSLQATLVESSAEPLIIADTVVVGFKAQTPLVRIQALISEGGFSTIAKDQATKYFVLHIPNSLSLQDALNYFVGRPEVAFVLPDNLVPYRQVVPCDPGFQNPGPFTQVQATNAWSVTTGNRIAVLADIDDGFDLSNPDLFRNYYINQAELLGANVFDVNGNGAVTTTEVLSFDTDGDGQITFVDLNAAANADLCGPAPATCDIDGDGRITPLDIVDGTAANIGFEDGVDNEENGFADDLVGWDFSGNDNLVSTAGANSCAGAHGVVTSGIIAANGATGSAMVCPSQQVAGMNWTARLLPVRLAGSIGINAPTRSNAYLSLRYAIAQNANVINASWGQSYFRDSRPTGCNRGIQNIGATKFAELLTALQAEGAAVNLGNSVLVVAAENCAQNDDDANIFDWPVEIESNNIVAVTSVSAANTLDAARAFGPNSIDIAAPGQNHTGLGIGASTIAGCNGNSFAAPLVTGAVGLIIAQTPALAGDPTALVSRLTCNATVEATLNTQVQGGRILNVNASVSNTNGCP